MALVRPFGILKEVTKAYRRTVEETLLDLSSDAFLLLDEWGRVRSLNAAAERLFGYTELEARGLAATSLCQGWESLPSSPSSQRIKARRKDGSEILIDVQVTRVDGADESAAVLLAKRVGDAVRADDLREANAARLARL